MAEEAARACATGVEAESRGKNQSRTRVRAAKSQSSTRRRLARTSPSARRRQDGYFAERVVGLNGAEYKGAFGAKVAKRLGSVAEITDHKGEPHVRCAREELRSEGTRTSGRRDDLSHGVESYDRRAM